MSIKYKKGPSDWWRPWKKPEASVFLTDQEKALQAFKGFISGDLFVTKKGNRGQRLDTMWAKYLLKAFESDDDELIQVASSSKLFDLECVVTGGEVGSPYSIGQLGFYSGNQIEIQVESIRQRAKALNDKSGANYMTDSEWEQMGEKFRALVVHVETPQFATACRGDTFAALAIRKNAFICAKLLIDMGIDPMKANEKDEDLFIVTSAQYLTVCKELKSVLILKDESTKRVFTPTEEKELQMKELEVLEHFKKMRVFILTLCDIVKRRLISIERDKTLKKIADMRGQPLSKEQLWNIAQEDRIVHHVHETDSIVASIDEKLNQYERIQKSYVSLAAVFLKEQKALLDALNKKDEAVVIDPKEERLRIKKEKELQRRLQREARSKEKEDKKKEEAAIAESVKEASSKKERYEGERDKLGNMHGKGILKLPDGSKYEGQFQANDIHGKGVLTSSNGDVYDGMFALGKFSGKGLMKYGDLSKYEGDWLAGMKHGRGIFEGISGDMYMGDFEKDKYHGRGFMQYMTGETYDGEWSDNMKHGKGVFTYLDQSTYEGDWVSDEATGVGLKTWPEGFPGLTFEGEFENGAIHGRGKFTSRSGGVYEGPVDRGMVTLDGVSVPIESWTGPSKAVKEGGSGGGGGGAQ